MAVIKVSTTTVMLFAIGGRRILKPRPVQLFRKPINWVDAARHLEKTSDMRLT
jgi:hypothetical protein